MVAAITGILMGIGSLLSYGGYLTLINSLTGNNSSALNTTPITTKLSNQSNNIIDGLLIPLNISTNVSMLELIGIQNSTSMSTQQKAQNTENVNKTETQNESNGLYESTNLQNDSIHKGTEKNEGDLLMGRKLDYEQEFYSNDINTYPEENASEQVENQISTDVSDDKLDTNDPVYQGQELGYTESPERLNSKLTLNTNNKNNMEKSEKETTKKMVELEPFPSLKRKLNNGEIIDDIPDNPLYKTHYETEHEEKVPVKNPLYPIHKNNENQHQENILHLNEIDSQSYEKINPKLTLNFNKNIYLKEDVAIDNEINSMEHHNLDSNGNIPEAESLINEDLVGEFFLESVILLEEEEVIKSYLGNTEVIVEDMNVKTLFTSYAEIAGIVIASVLIVTGLIFLSIRQAMKHRRQHKIKRRYAENKIGQVDTLTYAYTNDVDVE